MGKNKKKLHPADAFRKKMRKRELKRNKGIRKTHRHQTMKSKSASQLQEDISRIVRLERLGQADEKLLIRKKQLEVARQDAIKRANTKKPEPEAVVIKGWSKIFRRPNEAPAVVEEDIDEDAEVEPEELLEKTQITIQQPVAAEAKSYYSKEEEESMYFDDDEIEGLADPAEVDTDTDPDSDSDDEPLLAAPPGLDAPVAPKEAKPVASAPADGRPVVVVPGVGSTAMLHPPVPPMPMGRGMPLPPFIGRPGMPFHPGMGRGMMPMPPMPPMMPMNPGPPMHAPPRPQGPQMGAPPMSQAPFNPSAGPQMHPSRAARGARKPVYDPLDPNPENNPIYTKNQPQAAPQQQGPGSGMQPSLQGPTLPPGQATQGPTMPGTAVQGPSMPGQATQGPTMPGREAKSEPEKRQAPKRNLPMATVNTASLVPTSIFIKRHKPAPRRIVPKKRKIVKPVTAEARKFQNASAKTEKALDSFLADLEAMGAV